MPNLENAIELAVRGHRGQLDRARRPHILHLLRMMLSVQTV
jgi:hypothetical protein